MSKHPATRAAGEIPVSTPMIRSEELLCFGQKLQIEHRGDLYTLRETRNGKLILTK